MDFYLYLSQILPDEQFKDSVKKRNFNKGEYLYQPPAVPNKVFEINSGTAKIGSYTSQGEDICYDIIYNKEVIGNFRYNDDPFIEFAKAISDLEVTSYDLNLFKHLIIHDPIISEWFSKSILSRKSRMENRLISIYSLNPKERVLNLLYELDKNIFCPGGKKIWIPDLLSEKDISQLTGLTRQTVSKILKSLCRIEQDSICLKFKKNH